MTTDDFDSFADVWAGAWEIYGKSVSPGALEMAFAALIGYELAAIRQALTRHVRDTGAGVYAPKPADVVAQIDGRAEDRCYAAWAKLREGIRRVGHMDSVAFDDPIIHAVVRDMGGWREVCSWDDRERPFKRHEFDRAYKRYIGHEFDHPPRLAGQAEVSNIAEGYEPPAPRLVGDRDRIRQVIETGKRTVLVHSHTQTAQQVAMRLKQPTAAIPHADISEALAGSE